MRLKVLCTQAIFFFFFLSLYVVLNGENNFLSTMLVMSAFSIYNDNNHFDTTLKDYKLN